MADLTHLWKVGQRVRIRSNDFEMQEWLTGYVQEVYSDHLIVYCNEIDHNMWFEQGMNMGDLYPEYNFEIVKGL